MLKVRYLLIIVLLIASFLRLWQLGNVPVSPDWDEVSLGYNAYSILKTGADEYGNTLPLTLKSFGDYKPALYSYIAIPSIFLFDLNVFSVRFPSAILGIISVFLVFIIVKELIKNEKIALISSFVLAISPWHLQFSRTAFEANLGVFLNLLTVFFFFKGLRRPYLLMFSAITSGLSIYAYQSEKVFAPLLMLSLILIFKEGLLKLNKKYIIGFIGAGILVILPMLFLIIKNPENLSRAASTGFKEDKKFFPHTSERLGIDQQNKNLLGLIFDSEMVVTLRQVGGSYLSHYDPNWLFIKGDLPRHHVPNMGLLYFWELPFILLGFYFLIFNQSIGKKTKIFLLSWFFIAPIPASFTNDVPHAVRTLNFIPTYQIFTALGLYAALVFIHQMKRKSFSILVYFVLFAIMLFNFIFYLNQYFVQQNYYYSKDWQYGYREAVSFTDLQKNNYEKIVISNEVPLDQSYIFFLFYLKYPPKTYQKMGHDIGNHNFDKYEFRNINWSNDENLKNTLIIGRAEDIEGGKIIKRIDYLNGETAIVFSSL